MKFKRDKSICDKCLSQFYGYGVGKLFHDVGSYLAYRNESNDYVIWSPSVGFVSSLLTGEWQHDICQDCPYILEHLAMVKQDEIQEE